MAGQVAVGGTLSPSSAVTDRPSIAGWIRSPSWDKRWIIFPAFLAPLPVAVFYLSLYLLERYTGMDAVTRKGAAEGGGILYIIRFFGNRHYKQDTLGLGDVKLMAASGLWLGIEGIVTAMTIGAFAGLVHGVLVSLIRAAKEKTRPNLHRLMIPAGPGFCIGIAIMLIWQYWV